MARSLAPAAADEPPANAAEFAVAPGLRVETFADGMAGRDIVAMQFAADGRLWVLESRRPRAADPAPTGAVMILADTDNDGRADQRREFSAGLRMPRGLALLADGALVSVGAEFVFLPDRDGDSLADDRQRVAIDFTPSPPSSEEPNGLFLAVDNWIYLAGSTLRLRSYGSAGFARDYVDRHGRGAITQDEAGRLYWAEDGNALRIEQMPSSYRWRNLGYRSANAGSRLQLARPDDRSTPGLADPGAKLLIYRGAGFGPEFDRNVFMAERSPGRIMRYRLPATGAVEAGKAVAVMWTKDSTFRLTAMAQGPDGWLYFGGAIGDGPAAGRIWRLVAAGGTTGGKKFPANGSLAELVGELGDANGWRRDTAQRLIIGKEDASAAPLLRAFLRKANPLGRLHALWTLEGLDAVDRDSVLRLVDDPDPRVSAAAIRLAEKFLYSPAESRVFAHLLQLVDRPEPEVRRQLVLSLGEAAQPEADAVLADAAIRWGEQPGMTEAVLSGISGREIEFIATLGEKMPAGSAGLARAVSAASTGLLLQADLRRMTLKPADTARVARLFALVADPTTPAWLRTAVVDGLEHFLPSRPRGQVNLTMAPDALVEYATGTSTDASRVRALLDRLNWPGKSAGSEPAPTLSPEEQVRFEKGRLAFPITCAGCHQPQGQGLSGLAPPLAGSRWVQGEARVAARIVLCGKVQEMYSMPTLRGNFDDDTIAAVLTFVRNSWGNSAGPVTTADVAAARVATANRVPMPFTDFELLELAADLGEKGQ